MANLKETYSTTCSGCGRKVELDMLTGRAVVAVESNGRRGSGHVPAHTEATDLSFAYEGDLLIWDCGACEYADSYDFTAED